MLQTQRGVSVPNVQTEEALHSTTEQESSSNGFINNILDGLSFVSFIVLFATIIIAVMIKVNFTMHSKKNTKAKEYWGNERNANFSRAKPITEDVFYHPDVDILSLDEILNENSYSDAVIKKVQNVKKISELKMVYFTKAKSNLELKLAYGASNLNDIIEYEENFQKYHRSIIELAKSVFECGHPTKAIQLAMNVISIYPNASSSYVLIAKIYHADEAYKMIERLKEEVLSKPDQILEPAVKNKIIRKIKELDEK